MDDRYRSAAPAAAPPHRRTRRRTTGALCAAVCLSRVALPTTPATAEVTDLDPSFEVGEGDLRFILKQIKLSLRRTRTTVTCSARARPTPRARASLTRWLPWGLRTVDGSYNNLMPGQSKYGAADQPFPRLLPEYLREGETAPVGFPAAR